MNEIPQKKSHNLSTATRAVLFIFGTTVLVLVGMLLGNAITPKPAPVTQVEVQEKQVTVYKTPKSCLDYIEYANQGFLLTSESLMYSGEALTAVSNFDYRALEALNKKIQGVNTEMDALGPKLNAAKAACAASK